MTPDLEDHGTSGRTEREEQVDGASAEGTGPVPGPAAADGFADALGHLQAAALSMVAAVRAALDSAEQLARDAAPLLDALVEASRAARPGTGGDGDGDGASGPGGAPGGRPRVERITVTPMDRGPSRPGAGDR